MPESEWARLVTAIAAGDQSALRALYERSHRIAFTLIMRITVNRETAEELTLDVFHDVWRRASQYDAANGPVLGWIMNQARSRAIDRLRHEQRRKRVNPHSNEPAAESRANECDEALEHEDMQARVRQAVASLSAQEREVIEAAYFSDLTYVEVASRFSQPLGTVKTRIRSGLRKLRQQLAADKEVT
jgi:RNA polymerase sigma-70 factor (ECF subfamily)